MICRFHASACYYYLQPNICTYSGRVGHATHRCTASPIHASVVTNLHLKSSIFKIPTGYNQPEILTATSAYPVMTSSIEQIVAPIFDFSNTPLANDYKGFYVKVLDDVFTPEECDELIALAESDQEWAQAAVHYGLLPNQNRVDIDYRNSLRILRFDHEAADKIYRRLLPYIQELVKIEAGGEWEGVVGRKGRVEGTWDLVGCVLLDSLA